MYSIKTLLIKKQNWLSWDNAARLAFLIGIFFLTFSPRVTYRLFIVACVLSLLGGKFVYRYQLLKENPITIPTLLVILIFIIGIFYGDISMSTHVAGLGAYTKLFSILFILHLFCDKKWRYVAENFLLWGVGLSIAGTLLYHFNGINLDGNLFFDNYMGNNAPYYARSLFINPLLIGPSAVFCCVLALMRLFKQNSTKLIKGINLLLLFYFVGYLFFINTERTNLLMLIAVLLFWAIKKLSWRGLLITGCILLVIGWSAYLYSNNFRQRIDAINTRLTIAPDNNTKENVNLESINQRLGFLKYSFAAIEKHPIIGYGTGSFSYAYGLTGGQGIEGSYLGEAHNEYVSILVQLGIIGLLIFLYWLASLLYTAFKLAEPSKSYAQLLVISLLIFSSLNEGINLQTGLFYIAMITIYFADAKKKMIAETC